MGIFSKFEGKVDDALDGMAGSVFKSPIEPTQIAKKCEKQMHRNKLVGKGVQYAPTLYTVLVNTKDDSRLFGFYPTLAGEIETYLVGSAEDAGLALECRPLVRFIADEGLKSGKFDVIAEVVTSNIVSELREEEAEYYGLDTFPNKGAVKQNLNRQSVKQYAGQADINQRRPQPVQNAGYMQNQAADYAGGAGISNIPPVGVGIANINLDNVGAVNNIGRADAIADVGQINGAGVAGGAAASGYDAQPSYGFQPGVLVEARTGQVFPIDFDSVIIGRESTNDIVLPDSSVSRAHARITRDQMGAWSVTDLNSTNGTKVNGQKITTSPLHFGDQITFGTTIMIFQKG